MQLNFQVDPFESSDTPATYGAICSQMSAFSSKYSQRSHCRNRVLSDFLNTLDFKLGKSKFSALINGKNYTFSEDIDGHFRTKQNLYQFDCFQLGI